MKQKVGSNTKSDGQQFRLDLIFDADSIGCEVGCSPYTQKQVASVGDLSDGLCERDWSSQDFFDGAHKGISETTSEIFKTS
jgi:hypothetical protein